jgi:hypothetical protein
MSLLVVSLIVLFFRVNSVFKRKNPPLNPLPRGDFMDFPFGKIYASFPSLEGTEGVGKNLNKLTKPQIKKHIFHHSCGNGG